MSEHTYSLQKYSGLKSRHTCPGCGKKHCFTLYVDENGDILDPSVGRCDHESACGYHYTPKEFFHDNPDFSAGSGDFFMRSPIKIKPTLPPKKPLCTIPIHYVDQSVRPATDSTFTTFLSTLFPRETITSLVEEYRLGTTRDRSVIYFQIDIKGRCRTGKVMKYNPQTGHRIKDEKTAGRIDWIHSMMKRSGTLTPDWELTQCLFGEHLLPKYPGRSIALVESEKTAVICSALMPDYIWLATGGKSQLGDKLKVLKGRTVTAFPDIDGYDYWRTKLAEVKDIDIRISNLLEERATPQQREAHIDIADLLISELASGHCPTPRTPAVPHKGYVHPLDNPAFRQIIEYLSPASFGPVAMLMDELDLLPIAVHPPGSSPVPQDE